MSISAGSAAYAEFTPQVLAARQAAQNQQIGVAIAAKVLKVNEAQGAALLQQLQAAAALSNGLGQTIDVRG